MYMMINLKKYVIISLLLFGTLFPRPVDIQDILKVSNNFILERAPGDYSIDTINLQEFEDIKHFYIVNLNPFGFMLLSAHNEFIPVLGYSFYNDFNLQGIPPQVEYVINSYKKNINFVLENQINANFEVENLWNKYLSDSFISRDYREVSPLISANWDQGGQWNDMCPEQTLVGCVAVAMSQVMYYWKNPIQGAGYAAYYLQNYGPISINFEEYIYDFNNMQDNNATPESQLLLYHAGVAVHMDYSHWGSGASVCWEGPSAQDALINNFNFIEDTACDTRINYDDEGWFEMLVEQLDNGWPMIFRAYGENDGPGHAWNIDGYQEGEYIHCNWGWGGSANGFYYFNNLNGGGYNFVENQAVLKNIFPQGISEPIALFDYTIEDFLVTFFNFSDDINENQIASWLWDFGDGNISEEQHPYHLYEEYGSYQATLIITDEFGQDSEPHLEVIHILDLTGDVNFDNFVDVVDIVTLVNLILYPENNFNYEADLNEDGMISIIDVVLLVSIILDN